MEHLELPYFFHHLLVPNTVLNTFPDACTLHSGLKIRDRAITTQNKWKLLYTHTHFSVLESKVNDKFLNSEISISTIYYIRLYYFHFVADLVSRHGHVISFVLSISSISLLACLLQCMHSSLLYLHSHAANEHLSNINQARFRSCNANQLTKK
jgi:hypothetical protein